MAEPHFKHKREVASVAFLMQALHQYIDSYHPSYLGRAVSSGLRTGARIYSEYNVWKRILRDRQQLPMPPYKRRRSYNSGSLSSRGTTAVVPHRGRSSSRSFVDFPSSAFGSQGGRYRFVRASSAPAATARGRTLSRSRSASVRSMSVGSRGGSRVHPSGTLNFRPSQIIGYVNNRRRTGRGRAGSGFGRMRKQRRLSKYYGRHGAVTTVESRGSVSDANAVYVGHGIAYHRLVLTVSRALVKMMYSKFGWNIPDWSDTVPFSSNDTHFINLRYFVSRESADGSSVATSGYGSGSTWNDVADALAAIIGSVATADVQYDRLELYDGADVLAADRVMKSSFSLPRLNLSFDFTSKLKVQNVTLAGTGIDTDDNVVTNIESNPLIGKHYGSSQWQNGFTLNYRPGSSNLNWDGFLANYSTGLISTNAADSNVTGRTTYSKPPPYFHFMATKGNAVRIDPGEIQTSVIHFHTRIMFSSLMRKTHEAFAGILGSTNRYFQIGFAKMLGLEKLLDAGSANETSLVNVHYEVVQKYKVAANEIPASTLPSVDVST